MPYQFASGYSQAGSLADLVPQPRSEGINPGRVLTDGSGKERLDGKGSCTLIYSVLTAAELDTLLTQIGFSTDRSVECTLRLKANDDRAFANYNGIIHAPVQTRDGKYRKHLWQNVEFRVTGIEAL